MPGDLVYILGTTRNELGGSEYYEHFGYVGLNVPRVFPDEFAVLYRALGNAIDKELVASAHGIFRGGLGVHLAMVSMGGNLVSSRDGCTPPVVSGAVSCWGMGILFPIPCCLSSPASKDWIISR